MLKDKREQLCDLIDASEVQLREFLVEALAKLPRVLHSIHVDSIRGGWTDLADEEIAIYLRYDDQILDELMLVIERVSYGIRVINFEGLPHVSEGFTTKALMDDRCGAEEFVDFLYLDAMDHQSLVFAYEMRLQDGLGDDFIKYGDVERHRKLADDFIYDLQNDWNDEIEIEPFDEEMKIFMDKEKILKVF